MPRMRSSRSAPYKRDAASRLERSTTTAILANSRQKHGTGLPSGLDLAACTLTLVTSGIGPQSA